MIEQSCDSRYVVLLLFSFSGKNLMGFYQNSLLLFTVKGKDLAKMTFQPHNSRSSYFVIFTKWSGRLVCTFDHLPPLYVPPPTLVSVSSFPIFVPTVSVQVNLNYIPRSSFLVWVFVLEGSLGFVSFVFVLFCFIYFSFKASYDPDYSTAFLTLSWSLYIHLRIWVSNIFSLF